jgi:hypothetical protein
MYISQVLCVYISSQNALQSTYKYPYLNALLHSQPGYLKSIEVRVMMAVNPTYSPVSGRERKVQIADYSALLLKRIREKIVKPTVVSCFLADSCLVRMSKMQLNPV